MTEEARQRQRLAAQTKALATVLLVLEEACRVLGEQTAEVGCAIKDLRLELHPASPKDRDIADPWAGEHRDGS